MTWTSLSFGANNSANQTSVSADPAVRFGFLGSLKDVPGRVSDVIDAGRTGVGDPHLAALATLETIAKGPLDSDYIKVSDLKDWEKSVDQGSWGTAIKRLVPGAMMGAAAGTAAMALGGPIMKRVILVLAKLPLLKLIPVAKFVQFPIWLGGAIFAGVYAYSGWEGAKKFEKDGEVYLHRGTLKTNILDEGDDDVIEALHTRIKESNPTDMVRVPMQKGKGRTGLAKYLYDDSPEKTPPWVKALRKALPLQQDDVDVPSHLLVRKDLQELLENVPEQTRDSVKDTQGVGNRYAKMVGAMLKLDADDPGVTVPELLRGAVLSKIEGKKQH